MPLTSGGTSTQTQAEVRTTELVSQDQLGCTGQQQSRIDMQQAHVAGQALSGAEAGAETADTETERERSSFVLPPAMSSGTCAETQADERTKNLAAGNQRGSTGQWQGTIYMQRAAGGTSAARLRVHHSIAAGGQGTEVDETIGAAGGQKRAEHVQPADDQRRGSVIMRQPELRHNHRDLEAASTETEHEHSSFVLPRGEGGTGAALLHAKWKSDSPARGQTSTGQQRGSIDMRQAVEGADMQRQPSSHHEGDSSGANPNDQHPKKHKRRKKKHSTIDQPAMSQHAISHDVDYQERPSASVTNPLWHGVLDSEVLDTAQPPRKRSRKKKPVNLWKAETVGRRRSRFDD